MKKSDITRRIAAGMLMTAMMAGMAACSDDSIDSPDNKDNREIRFEISGETGWNDLSSASRAADGTSQRPQALPLTGGDSTALYLVPRVTAGIEINKEDGRSAMSRGTALGTDGIESFGVYASLQDGGDASGQMVPDYMFNVEVTRAAGWAPAEKYLWPGSGKLHINAYSPYQSAAGTEGITEMPASDSASPLSISYVTPAEVADQIDLMYATPVEGSSSPCRLSFNHALTAIRFITGAEMAPCTVRSISISGVAGSGRLNIETGEWTELADTTSYIISPAKQLLAADGSKYVAAGEAISSPEETFLLIPQALSSNSKISLTIEKDGVESTLNASLSGQEWKAGTTVTYSLSANPESSTLTFEVLDADGNPVSRLSSPYTGGTSAFKVRSLYDSGDGTEQPVEWKATFVTDDGKTEIEMPSWIVSGDRSGSGETSCSLVTDLPEPIFLSMSEQTRLLRNAEDINTSTGVERYNLSNPTGAATVQTTANTYIVNAPGKYSLPLVYGNAVKNGAKNEGAYISTLEATAGNKSRALFHFVNHLGNEITDPYIYNNASCQPHDAVLIWEDRINLVRNVALSADGHSIEFDVPAASIRQGNAMIAVRDAEGTVMWSWQIWITDYKPAENTLSIPQNGTISYLYARSLGTIYAGDRTEFKADSVVMRLTQVNVPDGETPLTVDLTISQAGKIIDTDDCYSFYQFGRKDPMVTALDQYYDSEHEEVSSKNIPTENYGTNQLEMIKTSIRKPQVFFTGTTSGVRPYYLNLWDISHLRLKTETPMPENVKTIYDPSPVGAKVPIGNVFRTLTDEGTEMTYDPTLEMATFTVEGEAFHFLALGYRQPAGGEPGHEGFGSYWTAGARSSTTASYFSIDSKQLHRALTTNMPLYGFAVRPVLEQ